MKKITSLCLSLLVLFSIFLTPTSAIDAQVRTDVSFTEKDTLVPVDLSSIDGEVIDISAQTLARGMNITETETVGLDDIELLKNTQIDIGNQIPVTNRARSNNSMFNFSGVIDTENGMYIIAPILLQNGQNIHAELVGPNNTNLYYDLRLYEMDINTSTLGNLVDISAYSNASSVFPQTIATVNTSGDGVYYALLVYARSGFSSTDTFEVNMSLGLGGDVVESNDNAFTAYPLGTITVNGALAQGVNLDSPLDVDWYQISIASNNDFNRISISNGLSSSVNYDLFYASSGTTMVKVAPANGYYPVNSGGTYYLRVTDNGNNFNTGNVAYAIDFSAILTPSRVSSSFRVVGMGSDTNYIPSQTYRVYSGSNYWGETRYALPSSCRLEWTSTLHSASGYLCKDASNLAHIRVTNDSWVPVEFRSASAVSPARQNGTTTCVLTKSVGCVGTYGDRDYDTDCTLSMWIEGYDSITNGEMPIFVTFKIWP